MKKFSSPKAILVAGLLFLSAHVFGQATTVTFNYTGSVVSWTVPACVTTITVVAKGAQGGGNSGGMGSTVTGTLAVTPGQVLQVKVGGAGAIPTAGYNGGGAGANGSVGSGGGGGATDLRVAPYAIANRVIVGGGGGGTGGGNTYAAGGAGACANGNAGTSSFGTGGTGGSQTAGGGGGFAWGGGNSGAAGSLANGGNGASDPCYATCPGGGGGGGYYGGGGGGSDCYPSMPYGGGGGGGGSCLTPIGGTCTPANQAGNGQLTITYNAAAATATASNTGPYCPGATIQLNNTGVGTYLWSGPNAFSSTLQNPTIPSATAAMGGVYTVTVTAVGGCTVTATTTVTISPGPTVTANNTGPYCAGTAISLSSSGGTTYSWSGPLSYTSNVQNPSIAGSTTAMSGVYTVTATVGSCTASTTTNVTVNPMPVPTASNTGPYCSGAAIDLSAGGGGTYSWSGPNAYTSSTQNPSIPGSTTAMGGVYTVTVALGTCTATATTNVTVNPPMVFALTSNSPICDQQTLNLGGPAGVSFNWTGPNSFTATTQNPSISPAGTNASGTYSLSATDLNGCVGTATIAVTVNALPNVFVNSTGMCLGIGSATLTAINASTYSWSTGATGNSITVTPTVTTTYTVTGTDANGCVNVDTAMVTVNVNPIVTVTSASVCPGQTANLTANGANSFTWSGGTTPTTGQFVTATATTTTTYTVIGTDLNGCPDTAIATVTMNPALVITASADDTVCAGNNFSVSVTGGPAGTNYTWQPGAASGANQTFIAPAATSTYTVTGVDPNGCFGSDSTVITVPAAIVLNSAGFPATCNAACNGQLVVLATPSTGPFAQYTYNWQNGGYTSASVLNVCAGTYSVTVTNNIGCTATATATVTEPTAVTANASGVTAATCNAVCDGAATINANGGTGAFTYTWSSVGVGANPTNLCAGNYTCTVADANSCSVPVTLTITEPTPITVSITPVATICIGQSATLNSIAGGGNGGYVYTWTGGTTPANTAGVSASPVTTSSYTVSVTDVNGCAPATASVTVTVNPALTVTASNDVTMCVGASSPLSALASGGNGTYTYSWSAGAVPTTGTNTNVHPAVTTTFVVTVTDGCGTPAASDSVIVTINQLPVLAITAAQVGGCPQFCTDFTASSTPAAATVNWSFTNGTIATGNTVTNICFNTAGTYGGTINVTDVNGCQNTFSNSNLVTVYPVPSAEFTWGPIPATEANPTITFADASTNATIAGWAWSFGNLEDSTSTNQNPSFTYIGAGTYNVMLGVISDNGCIDSVMHEVTIDQEFLIYAPNTFTPNADGTNDVFFPKGVGIDTDNYEMWVYDRWGNMIFATDEWTKGWDGKAMGKDEFVQQDVYVWKIKLRTWDGQKKSFVGHVTVVK